MTTINKRTRIHIIKQRKTKISKKTSINNKTDKYYLKYLFENYKKIKFNV